MERRSFLSLLGLAGVGTLFTACAVTVDGSESADGGADDATAPTDRAPTSDTPVVPLVDAAADARVAVETTAGGVVIAETFEVLLNDSTCSGHSHSLTVLAGTYPDGVLVRYLGGSHLVTLLPSELSLLERGARLPFATAGNGPGHGHCGTAWRTSVGPEEPHRPDVCELHNTTAACVLHH
ncbi:MAG: hypothetical protein U0326_27820 [Polyangiales bacterium]